MRETSTIRYCDPEFEIICKNKYCKETHYYKDLRIANTISRKCVKCGFDDCWNMQVRSDYDFCCLDVPPKYIKKPFRDWACSFCTVKYVEGFSYKVERII